MHDVRIDIRKEVAPDHVLLTVSGELDLATAPALQARLTCLQNEQKDVELDLSQLAFMDIGCARMVSDAAETARARRRRLCVRSPLTASVSHMFKLLGLERLFC